MLKILAALMRRAGYASPQKAKSHEEQGGDGEGEGGGKIEEEKPPAIAPIKGAEPPNFQPEPEEAAIAAEEEAIAAEATAAAAEEEAEKEELGRAFAGDTASRCDEYLAAAKPHQEQRSMDAAIVREFERQQEKTLARDGHNFEIGD